MSHPLRIGIDARELLGEATGVGRYLGELIRRWTLRPDAPNRRFILYSPAPLKIPPSPDSTETRVVPGTGRTWWEQTALRKAVRADPPDVFFSPAYTAPLALGVPLAVTIHDISFIAHPEWFRPRERLRRRLLTTRAARVARVVLTDSQFSRSEIEASLHVPPERLRVIPPGINANREPRTASREPGKSNSEPRTANRESRVPLAPEIGSRIPDPGSRTPLVLFVGSLFNRRHLPDLIAAFAQARKEIPEARLAIVGPDRTWPKQDLTAIAKSVGVSDRVELRSYVQDDELRALYARASVFAFLSEYEGFGLTPLEALAAGVPIVVLDTAIAREVYGSAAEFVPSGDIDRTVAALVRFLQSRDAAREQLSRAPAVLARYSWERAAEETLSEIERIARRSSA